MTDVVTVLTFGQLLADDEVGDGDLAVFHESQTLPAPLQSVGRFAQRIDNAEAFVISGDTARHCTAFDANERSSGLGQSIFTVGRVVVMRRNSPGAVLFLDGENSS